MHHITISHLVGVWKIDEVLDLVVQDMGIILNHVAGTIMTVRNLLLLTAEDEAANALTGEIVVSIVVVVDLVVDVVDLPLHLLVVLDMMDLLVEVDMIGDMIHGDHTGQWQLQLFFLLAFLRLRWTLSNLIRISGHF